MRKVESVYPAIDYGPERIASTWKETKKGWAATVNGEVRYPYPIPRGGFLEGPRSGLIRGALLESN